MDKLLLTPLEAAEALGIGRSKVYELMSTGALTSVHIGTCRRIPAEVVHDFVAELQIASQGLAPRMRVLTSGARPDDGVRPATAR